MLQFMGSQRVRHDRATEVTDTHTHTHPHTQWDTTQPLKKNEILPFEVT